MDGEKGRSESSPAERLETNRKFYSHLERDFIIKCLIDEICPSARGQPVGCLGGSGLSVSEAFV